MKAVCLGLFAVLTILSSSSLASAPSSECPQNFEGQWICQNLNSKEMTEIPVKAIKRGDRIYSYFFAGEKWPLSNKWAPFMTTHQHGVNGMLWTKNRCKSGVLISGYKFIDENGNLVGGVHGYETKMDNVNQFSIYNADKTINHVCNRK